MQDGDASDLPPARPSAATGGSGANVLPSLSYADLLATYHAYLQSEFSIGVEPLAMIDLLQEDKGVTCTGHAMSSWTSRESKLRSGYAWMEDPDSLCETHTQFLRSHFNENAATMVRSLEAGAKASCSSYTMRNWILYREMPLRPPDRAGCTGVYEVTVDIVKFARAILDANPGCSPAQLYERFVAEHRLSLGERCLRSAYHLAVMS